ncbi:MAG: TlpA family protein disulfide reductase [Chitinophagaceae bacterium]|nr:TlpA family protein disulfide reductase [Chitinophagaceae bacterium]
MKRLMLPVSLLVFSYGCISSTAEEKKDPVQTQESVTPPAPQPEQPSPPETTPAVPQTTATTSALPSAMIMDANNQTLNLSAYKGKKVFVNLWATWCGPCRAEIPSIESLAAKSDKSKVAFVMLSLDDNFDKARGYA